MLKAIAQRCSCRAYTDTPPTEEEIATIVEAGMKAPSGMNVRPWHIVVVTDQQTREKLAQTHQWSFFCAQSPVVFAVCGDEQASDHWWAEDCAAVIENMLIQATDLGLGTCWIGIRGSETRGYDREDYIREVLGIPAEIRVSGLIACGHPAKEPQVKPAGPMENVHRNGW